MKKHLLKSDITLTLSIIPARPIRAYLHIFNSQTIPIHSRWKKLLLKSIKALTLSTYHISQTDQNLPTHLHQPDYTNPLQMQKQLLLKNNIALTLSTYHNSQTDQNLLTHLHQPDYTNPFQMKKLSPKSNIALTLSTYHISQTNQNLSTHLHQQD